MQRTPVVVAPALVLLILAACAEPPHDADAPATLIEDLRLDANAEQFSIVSRTSIGPRGQIAIAQLQDRNVLLYDSAGKRLAVVGRPGSGPGEFEQILTLGWHGDSLWVFDFGRRALSYFLENGSLIRTEPLPQSLAPRFPFDSIGGLLFLAVAGIGDDGSFIGEARINEQGDARNPVRRSPAIVRASASGGWNVLHKPPPYEDSRWYMEASGFGRPVPFAQWPARAIATDGSRMASVTAEITSGAGGSYTLTVAGATGDTLVYRSYPFAGVPIPQSARDSAIEAEAASRGGASEGPSNLDQQFQRIAREKIPPFYAPVQYLVLGLDDSIWITLRDSAGVRTTIVLDGAGDQIGKVVTSTRSRIRHASRNQLWVTEIDGDGLASVVRYRVSGLR